MKRIVAFFAFAFIMVLSINSQSPDEILKKYFENIGGIEKWKNMKSMKMAGNLVMSQGEFPCTLYRKAPNKFKVVLNIMGQELIPQAFDGTTGWTINPYAGASEAQKLPDEQVKALLDEAAFEDPFIDYTSKGYEVTYEGEGNAAGTDCFILKLVKNKGKEGEEMTSHFYFDKASSLQIMVKQANAQTQGQEVEIYLSDYQDAGNGIMMPFVIDTQMQGNSIQKLSFKTITIDEEMPDELFAFPAPAAPAVQ